MESTVNAEIAKNIETCARQLFEVERKVQILKAELTSTVGQLRTQTLTPAMGQTFGVPSFGLPITGASQGIGVAQGITSPSLTPQATGFVGTPFAGYAAPFSGIQGTTWPYQGIHQGIPQGISPYAGIYGSPYGYPYANLQPFLGREFAGNSLWQQQPWLTGFSGVQQNLPQGVYGMPHVGFGAGITNPFVHGLPAFGQGFGQITPFTQGVVNPQAQQYGYIW